MSEDYLRKYHFDAEEFERLRTLYREGRLSLESNVINRDNSWEIAPPRPEDSVELPTLDSAEAARGRRLLSEGRCAMILMNGGAATRFQRPGEEIPKGAFEIMEIAGRPRSFMEIKLAHARWAEKEYGGRIPVWILNSYFTDEMTGSILRENRFYGKESVFTYCQGIMKRLVPMPKDLETHYSPDYRKLKEAAAAAGPERGRLEKELRRFEARFDRWKKRSRDSGGEVFSPRNPRDAFNPPGHLDATLFLLLDPSRPLLRLLEQGVRYVNIANIDNLGATVHPALFGLLESLEGKAKILCEVSEKPPGQKGGALARVSDPGTGREWTQLIEEFAFPPGFDQDRIPEFNNATYTIALSTFLEIFELDASLLPAMTREELVEKVRKVTSRLPVYVAVKEVKEKDEKAGELVYPVVQFERLQGDLTRLAPPLGVGTSDRFFPVKKREDIPRVVGRLREVLEGRLILNG